MYAHHGDIMNSNISIRKGVLKLDIKAIILLLIIFILGIISMYRVVYYRNDIISVFIVLTAWIPLYFVVYIFGNVLMYWVFFRSLYYRDIKRTKFSKNSLLFYNIFMSIDSLYAVVGNYTTMHSVSGLCTYSSFLALIVEACFFCLFSIVFIILGVEITRKNSKTLLN